MAARSRQRLAAIAYSAPCRLARGLQNNVMKIWVDADACPNVIKDIIFRAAARTNTHVVLVANKPLRVPLTGFVSTIQVSQGFDIADNTIVKKMQPGDLIITADIPLADAVIDKGGLALNPRGELYTSDNIKGRLTTRNHLEQLRDVGVVTGGPKTLGLKERQAFANQLDRLLAARPK
jgi:uncharacterized protein YaiI (UPF0178 family)